MRFIGRWTAVFLLATLLVTCSCDEPSPLEEAARLRESAIELLESGEDPALAFSHAARALTLDYSFASAPLVVDAFETEGATESPASVFEPLVVQADPLFPDVVWLQCLQSLIATERGADLIRDMSTDLLMKREDWSSWAGYVLAWALEQSGHVEEAGNILATTAHDHPDLTLVRYAATENAILRGDRDLALRIAQSCKSTLSDNVFCFAAQAQAHYAQGDAAAAIAATEALFAPGQDIVQGWFLVARFLHSTGHETDQLIETIERFLEVQSHESAPWCILGAAHLEKGQDAKAEDAIREGLERDPRNPRCLVQLGHRLVRKEGGLADAKRAYEEALALAPTLPEVKLGMVRHAIASGNPQGAIPWLDSVKEERYLSPRVLRLLGELQLEVGDAESAAESFTRGLNCHQKDARLLALLEKARATAK